MCGNFFYQKKYQVTGFKLGKKSRFPEKTQAKQGKKFATCKKFFWVFLIHEHIVFVVHTVIIKAFFRCKVYL